MYVQMNTTLSKSYDSANVDSKELNALKKDLYNI